MALRRDADPGRASRPRASGSAASSRPPTCATTARSPACSTSTGSRASTTWPPSRSSGRRTARRFPPWRPTSAGTYSLLEACRSVGGRRAIVVASSDKAYGDQEELPFREDFALRASYPYEVSKACGGIYAFIALDGVTRGQALWSIIIAFAVLYILFGERGTRSSSAALADRPPQSGMCALTASSFSPSSPPSSWAWAGGRSCGWAGSCRAGMISPPPAPRRRLWERHGWRQRGDSGRSLTRACVERSRALPPSCSVRAAGTS